MIRPKLSILDYFKIYVRNETVKKSKILVCDGTTRTEKLISIDEYVYDRNNRYGDIVKSTIWAYDYKTKETEKVWVTNFDIED